MRSARTSKTTRSFQPSVEMLEVREVLSTFYIATNGNDSSAGSSASPWATLQHAANTVKAGDTVIVEAGNYKGFDMTTSGTASAMIRFLAQPGVNITSPEATRGKDGINLEGASYIEIQGFNASNMTEAGIRAVTDTGCVIDHNNTNANGMWGIFTGFSNNVLVEDNTCSNSVQQHGIYISNSCVNPEVIGNTCFGNNMCGIHMNGDISQGGTGIITGAIVEDNVIYNNGAGGGSGINCDGVQNSIIEDNLLYNNHASGISLYQIDAAKSSQNDVVANNTVVMASNARWAINIQNGSINNTVFNNILLNNNTAHGSINISSDSLSGFHSNNNVLTTNSSAFDIYNASTGSDSFMSYSSWESQTGQDKQSLTATASPLFANVSGNNYQLLSTSPAIDRGVASLNSKSAPTTDILGKPRPSGNGYDIGAYEFQSTTSTNPPPTVATAAAASPGTVTGTSTNLSVLGADNGGESSLTYTWASSGPAAVSFSANGTNASKNSTATFTKAGSYTFTVTIKDSGGLTVTSNVNVTVNQTLTSISVSPASASVAVKGTQQFTATAKDQFGTAMASQPSFTWSTSGGGTISSSGLFTASTVGGPFTITASGGGKSGTSSVTVTSTTTASSAVDINTGGGAAGSFQADAFFSGGTTASTSAAINTSQVTNPAPQSVYQTERYGNFTYTIPNLTPGASYTVRLDFAEFYWSSAGQRVFNVAINGAQVLSNFGIFAAAGGKNIAIARSFTATANSSGQIVIQFTTVKDNAKVSGIEVTANSTATKPSVLVDAGGPAAGSFQADAFFSGGTTASTSAAINTSQVSNPAPQSVYQTERYGNFTYTIPNLTPGASYTVRLDFAEFYWSSAGQRVFNVAINGAQVLSNFDIFAAAGGEDIAIARSFTATANSSGQIVIGFTTVKDNAKVSGIEITPN